MFSGIHIVDKDSIMQPDDKACIIISNLTNSNVVWTHKYTSKLTRIVLLIWERGMSKIALNFRCWESTVQYKIKRYVVTEHLIDIQLLFNITVHINHLGLGSVLRYFRGLVKKYRWGWAGAEGGGGGGSFYFILNCNFNGINLGMMIGLINLINVLPDYTAFYLDQKGTRQRSKKFSSNLFFGVELIFNRSKGNSN